jgi:hypothetical protein
MAEYEGWAIVELMGHRKRPGYVTEVEFAGSKMLRIDIPTTGDDVTEFYGAQAIYAIRPAAENVVRECAERDGDPRPIRPLEYREPKTIEDLDAEVPF